MWHKLIGVVEKRDTPDLSEAPTPLTDDDVLGFGQYADTKLKDVPITYLQWMVQNEIDYPRSQRSKRWITVMNWIKSKK
jgi:uncharacterized protein (DUF3820 family)